MSLVSQVRTRAVALVASAVVLGVAACDSSSDSGGTGPLLPPAPSPVDPELLRAAWQAEVDVATGDVTIKEPSATLNPSIGGPGADRGPDYSILGGDVVNLISSAYDPGTLGVPAPNQIEVSFDVQINNRIQGIDLITPTFPTPPSADGIFLIHFAAAVPSTTGGTTTIGEGNEIEIVNPNRGLVRPGSLFSAPFNFFNDTDCGAASSNDCLAYAEYAQPLGPLGLSEAQRVSYIIDATVNRFTVFLLLAANIQDATPPATTDVSGTISESSGTPNIPAGATFPAGVTVEFALGSNVQTGVSTAGGAYGPLSITGSGVATLEITDLGNATLNAFCTAPPIQNVNLNGTSQTIDLAVDCSALPAASGTVTGTVDFTGAGLTQAQRQAIVANITPDDPGAAAGSANLVSPAAATGTYSGLVEVGTTPAGSGTVSLSNLPSGCTASGDAAYTGLTDGGSVAATPNITVDCAATFPIDVALALGAGNTMTVSVDINMGTQDLGAIAIDVGNLACTGGRVSFTSVTADQTQLAAVAGNDLAGDLSRINAFSLSGSFITGASGLWTATFSTAACGSGDVIAPAVSVSQAGDQFANPIALGSFSPITITPTTVTLP